jgi:hypothetical protein
VTRARIPRQALAFKTAQQAEHFFQQQSGARCVGEYISRCPMPLKALHCPVSKLFNSDTCPRPTTGCRWRAAPATRRPTPGVWSRMLIDGQNLKSDARPRPTAQGDAAGRVAVPRQGQAGGAAVAALLQPRLDAQVGFGRMSRFRSRATESVREFDIPWPNGGATQQCDRT